jgi:hypothetical protein
VCGSCCSQQQRAEHHKMQQMKAHLLSSFISPMASESRGSDLIIMQIELNLRLKWYMNERRIINVNENNGT